MFKLTDRQKELFEKIDSDAADTQWRDWKWQLRHQIRDIDTFEELLGVQFEPDERRQLEETVWRFPIAITPYYLSLIDIDEMQNDPVFKQAFPMPQELSTCTSEMADPLSEDKDSPAPGMNITFAKHGYHYAGTLNNNTNICGRIESMNVWYKSLGEEC